MHCRLLTSEISRVKVGHVYFLDQGVRGVVDHADPYALSAPVGLQPVEISLVGALPQLGEQVGQHREGSSPEVYLEPVQVALPLEGLHHYPLLESHIPGKEDEQILNVGGRKVPHPVVPLDLVRVREVHVHSRYYECLSPHLPNPGDLFGENWANSGPIEFLQEELVRVLLSELQLEGKVEVLGGIFPEKLADVLEHGVDLGDSEGAVVDGEGLLLVDPEIQVPESCLQLIFDIPCLALVDHADLGAGEGAGIVRPGDRHVGNEQVVAQISHPVEGQVVGVGGPSFVVVLVDRFGGAHLHQVLEMLLSLVQQVAHPQQQPQEDVFHLHHLQTYIQSTTSPSINHRSPSSPSSSYGSPLALCLCLGLRVTHFYD